MKVLKKAAISTAIAAATFIAPAQAQTWTNAATGLALPIGQPITMAGVVKTSSFYYLRNLTCNVSIDGTVTASDTITFYQATPGFAADCTDPYSLGSISFPFDAKAQFSGASPTGDRAIVNLTYSNAVGICNGVAIPFDWYDASISEGQLASNYTVFLCTMHAGSKMRVTAPASLVGNVDIR